jgi:hypothetical protein
VVDKKRIIGKNGGPRRRRGSRGRRPYDTLWIVSSDRSIGFKTYPVAGCRTACLWRRRACPRTCASWTRWRWCPCSSRWRWWKPLSGKSFRSRTNLMNYFWSQFRGTTWKGPNAKFLM